MNITWQIIRFFAYAILFIFGALSWRWAIIEYSWQPIINFLIVLFILAAVNFIVRKALIKNPRNGNEKSA